MSIASTHRLSLAGYGVDPDTLKVVAASLPTAVTVVTTVDCDGNPYGMTSGAVCSVSAEPALFLTSVSRTSRTLPILLERGSFVINILHEGAAEVSNRFATPGEERFTRTAWRRTASGLPLLHEDALAYAECQVYEAVPAGDHVLVIGLVVDGGAHVDNPGDPLLYFKRSYAAWSGVPRR
jgi:3-hydroxy-9,10-secoandrosta-1,3,5(10)-triene-9,17-dione monooxygenase reductase component